jgi:1-hydroxycarotenoid 3,4-desaturase
VARDQVAIIGAGIGGLSAAIRLAQAGCAVSVFEAAAGPGGKMRQTVIGGLPVDAGPTVLTMRWVFEDIFARSGARLEDNLTLRRLSILARHVWPDGARLDLFADAADTAEAIGAFSGAADARGYLAFCAEARRMYETLRATYLTAQRPNPLTLTSRIGLTRLGDLLAIRPFDTMWRAISAHFRDPRLRQLFGRYATYCGSSPYQAPATLMLIAHVEQEGVWTVDGGMHALARALEALAKTLGVRFHYNADVAEITTRGGGACGLLLRDGAAVEADQIICNADSAALANGVFGADAARAVAPTPHRARSLSAVTWALRAETCGIPLVRHNVFFSDDYAAEFNDILRHGRLPGAPTIYVCAQDRNDSAIASGAERLLVLVNAPASAGALSIAELNACETNTFATLRRAGLEIDRTPQATVRTSPEDFDRLFPATGGALYGRATHGWTAAFQRPPARTRMPNLYLAGGSAHPGAGVPMAALSGQLAAEQLLTDHGSTRRLHPVVMPGGTSTPSVTTRRTA